MGDSDCDHVWDGALGTQLNATAVPSGGTFTYTPAAGTILPAGTNTLSVTLHAIERELRDTDGDGPAGGEQGRLDDHVGDSDCDHVWDGALGTQLNATAAPSGGTFTYTPAAGTILPAGTNTLSVLYTPSNANYATQTATVSW